MVNYLHIIGDMGQRVGPGFMEGINSLSDVNPQFGVSNRNLLNSMASAGYGHSGNVSSALTDITANSPRWDQMNKILGTQFVPQMSTAQLDPRVASSFAGDADLQANFEPLGVSNMLAMNAMANLGFGASGTPASALTAIGANPTLLSQMNRILGTSYAPPAATPTPSPSPAPNPSPTPSPSPTPAPTPSPAQPPLTIVKARQDGSVWNYTLSDGSARHVPIEWGGMLSVGSVYPRT